MLAPFYWLSYAPISQVLVSAGSARVPRWSVFRRLLRLSLAAGRIASTRVVVNCDAGLRAWPPADHLSLATHQSFREIIGQFPRRSCCGFPVGARLLRHLP